MDKTDNVKKPAVTHAADLSERERQLEQFSEEVLESILEILKVQHRKNRTAKGGESQPG